MKKTIVIASLMFAAYFGASAQTTQTGVATTTPVMKADAKASTAPAEKTTTTSATTDGAQAKPACSKGTAENKACCAGKTAASGCSKEKAASSCAHAHTEGSATETSAPVAAPTPRTQPQK
jgi:hypothetical protein